MSKAGDTVENPVTGEQIVVRVCTEDSGGELLAIDGYVRPGGASLGSTFIRPSRRPSRW